LDQGSERIWPGKQANHLPTRQFGQYKPGVPMETVLILIGVFAIVTWIWLNVLASIAVTHDSALEPTQRKGQLAIVWLIPFFGAAFILHLVFEHHPQAIPKKWIPWPFRHLIYGEERPRNRIRNDDDSAATNGSTNRGRETGSDGGDAGGGD